MSNRRREVHAAGPSGPGDLPARPAEAPAPMAAPASAPRPVDGTAGDEARAADCVYLKVRQLARSLACHYDAELGQVALRTTQFGLLSAIKRLQPVQPSVLAQDMGLDPSTLSRNLRPLSAAGWVLLRKGADGRKKLLTLTQPGLLKEREGFVRWRDSRRSVHAMLGNERVARLQSLVDEYLTLLERPVDAASPPR